MDARGVVVGVLACLALAGCGDSTGSASHGEPFALPVGLTEWDVSAPAWFHDGTLHVGERTVESATGWISSCSAPPASTGCAARR